jgi:hypothetical protein
MICVPDSFVARHLECQLTLLVNDDFGETFLNDATGAVCTWQPVDVYLGTETTLALTTGIVKSIALTVFKVLIF